MARRTFAVGVPAIGQGSPIKITKQIYDDAVFACNGLLAVTTIEEAYDIVVRNFELLYDAALKIALETNLYSGLDRWFLMKYRRDFNRLLGNFLTSCQALEDITNKQLSNALGRRSRPLAKHRSLRIKAKESSLSFRLMEAIRDLQQHAGLVVSGASPHVVRVNKTVDSPIAYSSVVNFDKKELMKDSRLKRTLEADLSELPDTINGIPHASHYLEQISSIHARIREALQIRIGKWEQAINRVHKILQAGNTRVDWSQQVPVAVFEFSDPSMLNPIRSVYIGLEIFEYRKKLRTKNRELKNLSRSYVTGQKL